MSTKISLKETLLGLNRFQKRSVLMVNDAIMALAALWIAYFLRVGPLSGLQLTQLSQVFVLACITCIAILWTFGFYNNLLRDLEIRILNALAAGVIITSIVIAAYGFFDPDVFLPRSVPIIFAIVVFLLIGGSRVFGRWYYRRAVGIHKNSQPILIYGVGETGRNAASVLDNSREFRLVGFLDDDKSLHGTRIKGRRIIGLKGLPKLTKRYQKLRILICIANLESQQRRKIIENLQSHDVQILTIPPLSEVVAGRASFDDIKEVKLQDLLGREQVPPIQKFFQDAIYKKTVLISGGGGSIGSEICMQIAANEPKKIIVLDNSEFALYALEQKMLKHLPASFVNTNVVFLLCNILDEKALAAIFREHKPDVVYHAAAYKHVPIVERQPLKGVENNILGTYRIGKISAQENVKHFTLVSTDKAVRPTNVMGATKRVAELVIQALQQETKKTTFSIVRFGNVLGSSGSVIPLFQRQIAAGGPVTVTHPEVTRYFMTIPEAAQLVIQSSFLANGADVYVLDMGEPILIRKLARLMIQLSGKTARDAENPGGEIEIKFTGLRPGEKLFEELHLTDKVEGTIHPKILVANEKSISAKAMHGHIRQFEKLANADDDKKTLALLSDLVDGFERKS
ncbi:MAG: nucleoside-diphosphate sugar epimerase/dehydratase [Pseudomonadota bacterium]